MEHEKDHRASETSKKEQGAQKNEKGAGENGEKGARGKKLEGAGSEVRNCEWSKEHRPSLTETHLLSFQVLDLLMKRHFSQC